jgi:hypothetical protein
MATLHTRFFRGDKVAIDGDKSLKAVVIAFLWRGKSFEVEIAWFSNGQHYTAWVDEDRLSTVEEHV